MGRGEAPTRRPRSESMKKSLCVDAEAEEAEEEISHAIDRYENEGVLIARVIW